MSHIDEGVLHAHLDGALRPGQADWAAAEAHLDVCHDCRRRLAEARGIRDGAATLLAGMSAKPLPRPSFQELAAAGAARRVDVLPAPVTVPARRRAPRWWNSPGKLAWAASLMLAVGAGWIGRQLAVEESFGVPSAALQRDASSPSAEQAASSSGAEDVAGNVEFETAPPPRPTSGDAVGALPEATGAREDVGAYGTDPATRANEARQQGQGDPEGLARLNESELQKEAAADRPGEANRDAVLEEDVVAPENVAAAPQRRLAEEAAEPTDERSRVQVSGLATDPVAAKAESSALCYVAVARGEPGAREMDDLAQNAERADGDAVSDAPHFVERIRLAADRTAGALVGGVAYVGYWADVGEDSIDVRLSDGQRQLALSLRPDGSAMHGRLTRAADARAGVADGEGFADDGTDGQAITLDAVACPTDP